MIELFLLLFVFLLLAQWAMVCAIGYAMLYLVRSWIPEKKNRVMIAIIVLTPLDIYTVWRYLDWINHNTRLFGC